jgi:O-antigen/teichoic acid export membrane protein
MGSSAEFGEWTVAEGSAGPGAAIPETNRSPRSPTMNSIPRSGGLFAALGRSSVGELATKAAVLATVVAAARILDPSTFAVYSGLLAVALLAAAFWDAGISTVVTTVASRHAPAGAIFRRVLVARLTTLPVLLAGIGLGFLVFGSKSEVTLTTVLAVSICSLAAATSMPLHAILRGRLQFGRSAVAAAAGRGLTASLTMGVLLVEPVADRLSALLLAQAAGELTTLAISALFVSRVTGALVDRRIDAQDIGLRRSLPFAANSVLNVAYNRLDIIIVATLTSTAQLAAYSPASRLQDALYLLPTALAAIALPYLSRAFASPGGVEASRVVVQRLWRTGLLLALPAAGLLMLGMPAVIGVLLGPEYEPSVPAARILSLSMIIAVIGGPILALLIAAGRGPATTRAFVAAFGASFALHLSLDWWLGSVGAAIASVSRDVVNVAVAAYCARDLLRANRGGGAQSAGVRADSGEPVVMTRGHGS